MINRRFKMPVPYWRWLRLPFDRAWERSLAELHRAAAGFIEDARRQLCANPRLREEPEDFLQSMIAAQETEDKFSDEEIVGNTITLLVAGEDTTAHTMAWTAWLLARNPDAQARWAEEASATLGDSSFVDEYETVERLRYGEAVLRESLRLRPVIPFTGFEPLADVTIADTHIPAGTPLAVMFRHAGLRESGGDHPVRQLATMQVAMTAERPTAPASGAWRQAGGRRPGSRRRPSPPRARRGRGPVRRPPDAAGLP